jgi:hypothetical protein
MTEPMHVGKRFIVFLVFIAIFALLMPAVILYSTGYRIGKDLSLTPTGGIYVYYPESGAGVYVDGKLATETSFFDRSLFVDELVPKKYELSITKEGYLPWHKSVNVTSKKVAEAYPYLVPTVISTTSIQKTLVVPGRATTTNPLYTQLTSLFSTTTGTSSASRLVNATSTSIIRKDVEIVMSTSSMIAVWRGSTGSVPYYFCDEERVKCETAITFLSTKVKRADFYQGRNDIIIYSTKNGIFITELDQRAPKNTFKLLSGDLDFREIDQRVFVKGGKTGFYELELTASSTISGI